jgi:hypothetical protein
MILPFFGRCRRQQMAAIAKKRLRKEMSLCQILEILSVTIFEKKPILLVFSQCNDASSNLEHAIHMNLLELFWDSTDLRFVICDPALRTPDFGHRTSDS